jgi:fructose-1,6-bisphosphatase/inositol monophosphatase family enzyme
VAEGRAVIFFEAKLQPWDYAAGSLIVKEAGGGVMDWNGRPLEIGTAGSVVAYGSGVTGIWDQTDSGQTVCFAPAGEGIR